MTFENNRKAVLRLGALPLMLAISSIRGNAQSIERTDETIPVFRGSTFLTGNRVYGKDEAGRWRGGLVESLSNKDLEFQSLPVRAMIFVRIERGSHKYLGYACWTQGPPLESDVFSTTAHCAIFSTLPVVSPGKKNSVTVQNEAKNVLMAGMDQWSSDALADFIPKGFKWRAADVLDRYFKKAVLARARGWKSIERVLGDWPLFPVVPKAGEVMRYFPFEGSDKPKAPWDSYYSETSMENWNAWWNWGQEWLRT